ncbi:hypothetical protein NQ317_017037 [Molorchus minor]|uniref:Uncharacterized protein n=1 Tax=Molorchus minor TaxID=1323400 RepID=A0ABQ9K5J1_9CUCU|nr:hypothetical protein NQ317_017037 [Molorchus minor]
MEPEARYGPKNMLLFLGSASAALVILKIIVATSLYLQHCVKCDTIKHIVTYYINSVESPNCAASHTSELIELHSSKRYGPKNMLLFLGSASAALVILKIIVATSLYLQHCVKCDTIKHIVTYYINL